MNKIKSFFSKIVNDKKVLVISIIIVILCVLGIALTVSFALPQVIKHVEFSSEKLDYNTNEDGSWHVDKSGEWIEKNKARVTFEVKTTPKLKDEYTNSGESGEPGTGDNERVCDDVILVIDRSESTKGEKLEQMKEGSIKLIDKASSKMALITFDSTSEILSDFTSDKEQLKDLVNGISEQGATNYYRPLVNVDELLDGYETECNIVVVFLADGWPNIETPNEVSQYRLLKEKYDNLTINAVQYQMGDSIGESIKNMSDNQYSADSTNLEDLLLTAGGIESSGGNEDTSDSGSSDTSYKNLNYEEFVLTDYVNNQYFDLTDASNIKVSEGTVKLENENGVPKVIWDLSGIKSGASATMTIDIDLKEEYHSSGGYYPTNTHETVTSKIEDDTEDVDSPLTPVLKQDYNVIYDGNAPEDCTVENVPAQEIHGAFDNVEISDQIPVCEGYQFKGWKITTEDVNQPSSDYFIMPESDVTLTAEWSKLEIAKSMDGTVYTYRPQIIQNVTEDYNEKLWQYKKDITNIIIETGISQKIGEIENWDISDAGNGGVMARIVPNTDDPTTYIAYIQVDGQLIANENSSYLFKDFIKLESIQGLENVDTSQVINMNSMFRSTGSNATTFNIEGLSKWDTSNVTDMNYMFLLAGEDATTFDIGDLSNWNTLNVTDMSSMFSSAGYNATTFDIGDLSNWNTSNVTDMNYMFNRAGRNATTWNIGDLSNWNTSKVTDMNYMFAYAGNNATTFDIGDLSGWDTSQVTDMSSMFYSAGYNATTFDIGDLSGWDTSNVTYMSSMFSSSGRNATTWNIGDLSKWDTSQVRNMNYMFAYAGDNATTWNIGDLSNWNTSQVRNMSSMFSSAGYNSTTFDIGDLSGWDTSQVTDMSFMFYSAGYNVTTFDIGDLSGWDTSQVTDMSSMFDYAGFYATIWNIGDLSNWNTSNVTDMNYMFNSAAAGEDATTFDIGDLSNWNTSNVTDMSSMFNSAGRNATTFDIGDLSGWDTSQVTNMSSMFWWAGNNATTWNIGDLSNWNTSKVTDMNSMFAYAGNNATTWNIGDLSGWDTSQVTDMSSMFNGVGNYATSINIGNLNIPSGCNTEMFAYSSNLSGNIVLNGYLSNYTNMFYYTATKSSSRVNLYYKDAESSAIVRQLVELYGPNGTASQGNIYNMGWK